MLTPEQKEAARENAEATKDAAADFKLGAALLAIPAAAQGILLQYGLLAAVFAALFERQVRKADRAANDPPRRDYRSETRVQRPRIDPSIVLRDTRFEDIGVPAANEIRQFVALLSAFVRAVERIDGAIEAGDHDAARWHADEALAFASKLDAVGTRARVVLKRLADDVALGIEDEYAALAPEAEAEAEARRRLRRGLPRDAAERLRKGGVPFPRPDLLKQRRIRVDLRDVARSLQRVGETTHRLGRVLASFEPRALP